MTPVRPLLLEAAASMWMNELFSSSMRSGAPPTSGRLPTPAPDSASPATSLVETNPPEPGSRRKTAPLPEITVASPPPPLLPGPTLPTQMPETGGT
jgi:hypothetical protein